jgi:hypothetical protein
MKLRSMLHTLAALVAVLSASAAELADLGQGLGYLRFRPAADTAVADLAFALNNGRPLVVDLRYVTAEPEVARTVAAAVAARTTRQPLFLLVSPDMTPGLLPTRLPPTALTLGIAGSAPAPLVAVAQTPEADRRAFAALDSGAEFGTLITGRIEKERFDEASLVKEFQNGNPSAEPPPSPDPAAKPSAEKKSVLTDRVLQRAVHLHRALDALPARPR